MVILLAITFGLEAAQRIAPQALVERMVPLGVLIYAGTGVAGLLLGKNYLDYSRAGPRSRARPRTRHLPRRGRRAGHRVRHHDRACSTPSSSGAADGDAGNLDRSTTTTSITIFLMMAGLYIVVARGNMVKKLVGLSIFQTSVYLLYIEPGKIIGGTAPIIDPAFTVYSNPLPHVLILTAIVVGVATLALGLALVVRINEAYGTIEEDEIFDKGPRDMNAVWPHLPALQVVIPLLGALLAGFLRRGSVGVSRSRCW